MEKKLAIMASLNLIKRRWYSAADLKNKLALKDFSSEEIDEAVIFLVDKKMLDDVRFARFFIKDRLNFNPKAKFIINSELKQKGISSIDIDLAWQEVTEEIDVDESKIVADLAKKKIKACHNLTPEIRNRRTISFLARKGYSYGLIKKALANLVE